MDLKQHVSTFLVAGASSDCSTLTSIEAYLIVDNATLSDAGSYSLQTVATFVTAERNEKEINVTIGRYTTTMRSYSYLLLIFVLFYRM